MNKSIVTNLVTLAIVIAGYQSHNELMLSAGLFALSGAVTNWLAVHMLFEKIPGVYGSGVIPLRFEAFKSAIKQMMMEQFFNQENLSRFLSPDSGSAKTLDLKKILNHVDFNPTFDSLVDVIMSSPFGGMLAMFGGTEALIPLKEPFVEKMKSSVEEMGNSDEVKNAVAAQVTQGLSGDDMIRHIEEIIELRLNELTPQLVKEMVQTMIREHLGWLVVWGGVFGGVIGLIAAYL
ncbi:DUF445 domain-containing protein [Gynuella sp.]|uniref:DUF445 domain-containing protein n=1 Tax=Gynuella sp. TaxID=2969146 RepID=UPI003D118DD4